MLLLILAAVAATARAGDTAPLIDPMRPVTEITRTSFTLQYFTVQPCETRVQVRQSNLPATAWHHPDPWAGQGIRTVEGKGGAASWHLLKVDGLQPGKRYYYRIYDPGAEPTGQEANWGAKKPWRREFACATEAPKGYKTVIHIPVKVLLMTNVIKVASATGVVAPQPPKFTAQQLETIKNEMRNASLYYWVNNGMRMWIDYHFFVDDRWQRWGPEPANVDAFYKGWPASRAWAGVDFAAPGGGDFNIVDTKDPLRVTKDPVYEDVPYEGQIEIAFLRTWNPKTSKWEFNGSGGGTLGVDSFPNGVPGRSQFLGGGDECWLTTHEYHHQLESVGAFSLSNREDERIVFNHPDTRHRIVRPDGTVDEFDWNGAGPHGEHYDCMEYWDRTLSDAQWLRLYFGEAITVKDADGDGVPDDDPRLPLDEKRFGSDPAKVSTDGRMGDLQKAMLSTWVPGPLQTTWVRAPRQSIKPNPHSIDTDGDGIPDDIDPYPLYPWQPFIYPMEASVDGDDAEWAGIPLSGEMTKGGMHLIYKQAHSEAAYYGLIEINGPWNHVDLVLDGEGNGVFSHVGVEGITLHNGDTVNVTTSWNGAKGLRWKSSKKADGATVLEFSLPNRGEGEWYWARAGRTVGTQLCIYDKIGAGYAVYEPYRLFDCTMLEPNGKYPMPTASAPADIGSATDATVLKPGDPALHADPAWKLENGVYRCTGSEDCPLTISGLSASEFDLWMQISAKSDAVLGAFLPSTKDTNAGNDYVAFVGGYGNTATRLRVFGQEQGDEPVKMTGDKQTVQMSRRGGNIWLLVDGKPVICHPDPNPKAVVDRLAVLGGWGGEQKVYEVRYRAQ